MSEETKTPRTDDSEDIASAIGGFIDGLKRELNAAKAETERLKREHSMLENINERLTKERDEEARLLREQIRVADAAFNHLNSEASELRAKLAEAEKDRERLRHVVEKMTSQEFVDLSDDFGMACEAIDDAMKGTK
jgi:predicted  nucleic acid-binding Zn-ribbon protein